MEYYPRKLEQDLEKWLGRKELVLIKGPRQAGKTTLLEHFNEKLKGDYVSLDDEDIKRTFEEAPKEFAKRFLSKNRHFLFVDEAQYAKNAGRILKFLFDSFGNKLKLIVTGSGSFDVKVEIGKYLVGRAIYFELLPLDFEEFLLWKAKDLHKVFIEYKEGLKHFVSSGKIDVNPAFEKEFNTLLEEFILFGGFPAIVKESDESLKKDLLKNLSRTYLEKDVFFFFSIRHLEKFRSLMNYLAFNTGSLLELSSLMRDLKMDYKTMENYLSVLHNTYLISPISPFHKNLTTELKKSKKIYFADNGLRNSIIQNFLPLSNRTDKGLLLENFILNELKSNLECKVNYWRTTGKAEVDFVVSLNDNLLPVEVKSSAKITRGFLSFLNTYKPKTALVFTEREFGIRTINGTKVLFAPHYFI